MDVVSELMQCIIILFAINIYTNKSKKLNRINLIRTLYNPVLIMSYNLRSKRVNAINNKEAICLHDDEQECLSGLSKYRCPCCKYGKMYKNFDYKKCLLRQHYTNKSIQGIIMYYDWFDAIYNDEFFPQPYKFIEFEENMTIPSARCICFFKLTPQNGDLVWMHESNLIDKTSCKDHIECDKSITRFSSKSGKKTLLYLNSTLTNVCPKPTKIVNKYGVSLYITF
jgi:hypothetical protein